MIEYILPAMQHNQVHFSFDFTRVRIYLYIIADLSVSDPTSDRDSININ